MKRNIAIVIGLVCLESTSWAGLYQGGVSFPEAHATFTGESFFCRDGLPTFRCDTVVDVSFQETIGVVVVEVNAFRLEGLICPVFEGIKFPWNGFIPDTTLPTDPSVTIPISLSGIGLNVCGSPFTVDVNFNNGGSSNSAINSVSSVLDMEGGELGTNCTLNFTLEAELGEDVDIR
ncbi:hypothetical protein [Alcanivorax xiamenensis]|uniref:hypothetical protein n=1 Tax=Alcanivorax xiamenensis TaxID=1177156 RepID=UPI00135A1EDD|nr:hypothetical protein [Alcanivorax xiamenensis]